MGKQLSCDTIDIIAKRYDIKFMVYFGSYQTEFYNAESDIDIAFLSKRLLSVDEKIKLLEELIIFHRKSEIDLVDLIEAEPILRYEIALNGRILYEKEHGVFEKYSLFYIKRFYELKPYIEEEMNLVSQKIKEFIKKNG